MEDRLTVEKHHVGTHGLLKVGGDLDFNCGQLIAKSHSGVNHTFQGKVSFPVICGGQGVETDTGLMEMLCCFAGHAEAGGILSVTEKQKLLLTIDT